MLPEEHRIAVFSLAYAPFEGGAEISCREIMARLPQFDFTVFTRRFDAAWPREERVGNVYLSRLGRGGVAPYYGKFWSKIAYVFRASRAAERAHRAEYFTAIWAIMASYGGIAALLFKLRHPRVPLLLTLQEGDSEAHILRRVGLFYFFWKKIFKRADAVTAISSYLEDFAKRHGATCPVTVVPNGVDISKFKVQSSKFKVSSDEAIIITTSRLVRKNGIDVLIHAYSILKTLYPKPYTLRIVGDGPEREHLERLTRELGINSRVVFLGQVSAAEIPRHLAEADLFVRPARSEGLGSSFLEAMAAGLPVVGTPVGGIPDFLKDGETGLFVKVDDPRDLAEKMAMLMSDAALRRKLATRGRAFVSERYGWDRVAERMKTIFENICVY